VKPWAIAAECFSAITICYHGAIRYCNWITRDLCIRGSMLYFGGAYVFYTVIWVLFRDCCLNGYRPVNFGQISLIFFFLQG
jgi:hypothetical protein